MGAEPVVVLYAIISVLNLIRAATGSQCKETKRGVTCSFGLVEDQSCHCILNQFVKCKPKMGLQRHYY